MEDFGFERFSFKLKSREWNAIYNVQMGTIWAGLNRITRVHQLILLITIKLMFVD